MASGRAEACTCAFFVLLAFVRYRVRVIWWSIGDFRDRNAFVARYPTGFLSLIGYRNVYREFNRACLVLHYKGFDLTPHLRHLVEIRRFSVLVMLGQFPYFSGSGFFVLSVVFTSRGVHDRDRGSSQSLHETWSRKGGQNWPPNYQGTYIRK